jgi:hypothetical protein
LPPRQFSLDLVVNCEIYAPATRPARNTRALNAAEFLYGKYHTVPEFNEAGVKTLWQAKKSHSTTLRAQPRVCRRMAKR